MSEPEEEANSIEWEVLNPVADYEMIKYNFASRLPDLNGKTIGLFWNGKPGGDTLLDIIRESLKKQYQNANFIPFHLHISVGADNIRKMAEQCNAVIAGTGD